MLVSRIDGRPGSEVRKYDQLVLERTRVVFFPLSWTIVHPITDQSPLVGLTPEQLIEREAEFLILLSGVDETFSQTVHARTSYKPQEVIFGARFANMYNPLSPEGIVSIDVAKLHDLEPAALSADAIPTETASWHHTGHFAGFAPQRPTDPGASRSANRAR